MKTKRQDRATNRFNVPHRLRAGTLGLILGLGCWMPLALAQQGVASKPAAAKSVAAKPVSGSPAAAGFSITPRPAWVQAVSLEGLPSLPSAPVQVLLMDDQTRVGAPGGTVRYQHALRQINSSAGLEAGSQIEFVFDPSYERLQIHELVIWREGKRLDRLDRKAVKLLQRETQLERQIVDGRVTASIVLEDLRVGDRVEWSASLVGDNPVFEGRFVDTQWLSASRGPVALVQRRLLAPAERKIRHRVAVPGVELSEPTRSDGLRETVLRRRAVPQFRYDPLVPAEDNYADLLEWSEFESWGDVAAWAERQFAPALREREPLAAKAAEIRAASSDPERRLELALDFVQKEIRYFGTEIGASSHRPAGATQVMRQRFGDCKDKAALLVNLLAQLEIEAQPALVSTTLRRGMGKRLPSPLNFDHAIVAVKRGEGWLWLDATRSLQTGPASERAVSGLSPALLARSGESAPLATPLAYEQLRAELRDVFSFARLAEAGDLVSEAVYYGEVAENLRMARASQPQEAFEALLMGDLARAYPAYQRQGAVQVEDVPGRNALRITQRLRANGDIWRLLSKGVMGTEVALSGVMGPLRLPDMTPREQALNVSLPGTYKHIVRFEFSEQAYARESEAPFTDSNEFFELRLRNKGGPRFGEFQAELQLKTDRIEAAQWARYRDGLQKVWPRLATQLAIPAIDPGRSDDFRSAAKALSERLRSGRLKVATQVQANAHYDLLAQELILAGKRLPPKLQARVQIEHGQSLDYLGQHQAARQAFENAIQLDPVLSEAQASLAVNALIRGQDTEAQRAAEQALRLAPNEPAPRYTRAQARYMAGDFAGASEDLRELLRGGTGSEAERGYRGLWLFLAQQAQGQDGRAATADLVGSSDKPAWPMPLLRMLRGELSLKEVQAQVAADKADQAGRECELYFFAAQKAVLERDTEQARRWLDRSLATGVMEFIEYGLARRERERLASR
ncbi:DUF3857 domain-containing protein [Roseateles sp.]|jgi:lipoprotein NlpI/transglutaminase-like putative cysteine protease|uniref:DUF3857 domain-containing protein n=1 Tax=Roseateles sp. TaxID=1971397 RepID=UPI00391C9716